VALVRGRRYIQGMEEKTYFITTDGQRGFSVQISYGAGHGVYFRHGFETEAEAREWIRSDGGEAAKVVRK
jgi:hypothetical protein